MTNLIYDRRMSRTKQPRKKSPGPGSADVRMRRAAAGMLGGVPMTDQVCRIAGCSNRLAVTNRSGVCRQCSRTLGRNVPPAE